MLIKFSLNAYTQVPLPCWRLFYQKDLVNISTGSGYFSKLLHKRVKAKIPTTNKIENETVLKFQT